MEYFTKEELLKKELQKGHSMEWAQLYAENYEEPPHAFNETYLSIKKLNPDQALDELKIHCKAIGGDEFYTKHFIFLMEEGEGLSEPDKQASIYSRIYKEQIAKGKTEFFANKYADMIAQGEYKEPYNFVYVSEYEKSIDKGYSDKYSHCFASKIADYITDHYLRYGEEIDPFDCDMKKQEIEEQCKHLK